MSKKKAMVSIPAKAWERIYELAIGAVDMDDAPLDVGDDLLVERAKACCEAVIRISEEVILPPGR